MARSSNTLIWIAGGVGVAVLLGGSMYGIAYAGGKIIGKYELVTIDGHPVAAPTARAFMLMRAAAAKVGIQLVIESGFRTMEQQRRLWNLYQEKVTLQAKKATNTASAADLARLAELVRDGVATAAKPGTSNHQNGRAIDIKVNRSFTDARYLWLEANASFFGFSNSEGKKVGEPWHWVFTGEMV